MRRKSIVDIHIKVILGVIVYLIIASVFGFNNQFLHEAFGKANTDVPDTGANGGGDGQDTPPSKDGSKDTSDTITLNVPKVKNSFFKSEDIAGSPDNSPPAPQGSGSGSPATTTTSSSEDLHVPDSKRGSDDINKDANRFRHNAEDIASELASLTPQEIREYPITDLSDKDIKLVMQFLNPAGLTKVLLYIPQQDLITIEHRLTHHDFDEYLNRLSESDRIQVESRLVSTSGSSLN